MTLTGLAGLEPTTYGLGNRRSIRLSYSPTALILGSGGPRARSSSPGLRRVSQESSRGDRDRWIGLRGYGFAGGSAG